MNQTDQPKATNTGEEITIKEFFHKIAATFKIKRNWQIVAIFSILGALAGLAYSIYKKPIYTAECTFVLEDGSKAGALGQYSSLASIAGIDLNSGGGLFQGDNILELYKSRSMIEKTLLSDADFGGKKQLLIERYIDFNKLRDKWRRKDNIQNITFVGNPDKFDRYQDSIITDIVKTFNKKVLTVAKLDKKLSIIVVTVSTTDELFSKEFTKKLVETVNNFYVQTKTKKSAMDVQVLMHQADSVKSILNSAISGAASAIDASPDANPLLPSLRVPSQKKQVDIQASTTVYAEIVKNLEISRISLRQDIPLIQIIDQPVLPLDNDHVHKVKGMVFGFILAGFITMVVLVLKRLLLS